MPVKVRVNIMYTCIFHYIHGTLSKEVFNEKFISTGLSVPCSALFCVKMLSLTHFFIFHNCFSNVISLFPKWIISNVCQPKCFVWVILDLFCSIFFWMILPWCKLNVKLVFLQSQLFLGMQLLCYGLSLVLGIWVVRLPGNIKTCTDILKIMLQISTTKSHFSACYNHWKNVLGRSAHFGLCFPHRKR